MTSNHIVFGGGSLGNPQMCPQQYGQDNEDKVFAALKAQSVLDIDSAQLYGESEAVLGHHAALNNGFTVSTKWKGGFAGKPWATYDTIISSYKESLKRLNVKDKPLDIFYLHCPDVHVPVEETLRGVNDAFKLGGFKRFGLSNFSPDQVREVLSVTDKHGWVKPSVYQGSYSAASRKPEEELLPLLREHGFAFYAYSPIAGGFLTKDRKFVEDGKGRFSEDAWGGVYRALYLKENFLTFLDDWDKVAQEEGVSKAELAFRWVNYHSALKPELGDAIIFGAVDLGQVERTPQLIQSGPLKEESVKKIDELWKKVRDDSIIDNFQAILSKQS